jgi:hypothetical protein
VIWGIGELTGAPSGQLVAQVMTKVHHLRRPTAAIKGQPSRPNSFSAVWGHAGKGNGRGGLTSCASFNS